MQEVINLFIDQALKEDIVIGAIIKGDTDHYEYVCQYVTNGISQLSALHTTPIIFGILTVQNEELAYERAAIDRMNKGKEFGETAQFMINAFEGL
jgi:6,7-dimethyl-8-ribityllumazine synthase